MAYHERIRANANGIVLYGAARITHGDVMLGLFYHSSQIPGPASSGQGTNFAHYRGIDDLLDTALHTANRDDREALYHQAQQRLMDDAVVLPLTVVPDMSVRNPKRVRTPFDPDLGESALHYFYNYPERFELLR
jgi:ABC-type transport system substrate-binding protein